MTGRAIARRRKPDTTQMNEPLRVIIAGGGTGGHLYPGIAVARELLARRPDARIVFAGTSRGIEARVVPREGFALEVIRSGGIKGKSMIGRARGAALLPLGLLDSWRLVSAHRPHLVIGVGGFSSGPVVLAAALRGVPTMLLEQNAVPGLTNRLLAPIVQAAAVTFDHTQDVLRIEGLRQRQSGSAGVPGSGTSPCGVRGARRIIRIVDHEGARVWRVAGRARNQRGHGGGRGGAGGRRFASSSHAPDGRARCADGPSRLPAERDLTLKSSRFCSTWDGESDRRT